ncbi:MAG: PDZ domain-containing protein [Saprospiraceae bacterium]|nr:PDZ domain-containing protein [Saprospiraceae bacterium]
MGTLSLFSVQLPSYALVFDHESEFQNAMLRNLIYTAVLLLGGSLTVSAQTQHRVFTFPSMDGGNQAFLGIMAEKISMEKAQKLGFENHYGSYVSGVIKNTAAEKAGIRPFDYIYGINKEVTGRNASLSDLLAKYEPGDQIDIQMIRNGSKRNIKATLGTREDSDYSATSNEENAFFGVSPAYSSKTKYDGAEITVVGGSSAERIGLEDGDIIIEFNSHRILDWTDLTIAIGMTNVGNSITVNYMRSGQKGNAIGVMGSKSDSHAKYVEPFVAAPPAGNKAFLGVVSDRISSDKVQKLGLENPYGYYVTEVVPGSAADKAGVKPMDYIYGIDEYRVGNQVGLLAILKKYEAGDQATLHFVRKGQAKSVPVRFIGKEEIKDSKKSKSRNACEKPFLGIMQGYDEDPNALTGVQVNIVENSSAQDAGLHDGDVISAINGYCMVDWNDITLALSSVSPGDRIELVYSRGGKFYTTSTNIKSYSETKDCADCDCGKKDYGIDVHVDMDELEQDFEELGQSLEELGEDLGDMIRVRSRGSDIETINVADYNVSVSTASTDDINQLNQKRGSTNLSTRQDLMINSLRVAAYPADQEFRLAFDLTQHGDMVVELYNEDGRRIYQYEASGFSGTFEDAINIGQNGSGNYYLAIKQQDKTAVRRIQLTTN